MFIKDVTFLKFSNQCGLRMVSVNMLQMFQFYVENIMVITSTVSRPYTTISSSADRSGFFCQANAVINEVINFTSVGPFKHRASQ